MGQTMKLSQLVPSLASTGSGILFVTACRGTTNMPISYQNLTANYTFPNWSLEYQLQQQNEISSRMLKRRRAGGVSNNNSNSNNTNNNQRVRRARLNNARNKNGNVIMGGRINLSPYMRMIANIKRANFPAANARRYTKFFPANMSNENVARWVNGIKRSNITLTNNLTALNNAVNSGSTALQNNWKNNNRLSKRILHRIYTIENRR